MKATELMIGDRVSVEDLIRCRVGKIFQDYVVCLDKRDNEIRLCGINELADNFKI